MANFDCHDHDHHSESYLHDVITKVTFLPPTVDVLKWLLVTRSSTTLSWWMISVMMLMVVMIMQYIKPAQASYVYNGKRKSKYKCPSKS